MYRYIFFFLTMVAAQACLAQSAGEALSPKAFSKRMQKTTDAVVLDVRTPEEFDEGRLKGAVNIDVRSDEFESKVLTLDKDKTYFVYCKAGVRGGDAQEKMEALGFKNVINLKGGIDEWKEQGLPVEE